MLTEPTNGRGRLDATSGHDAIMAEVRRLCADAGAPHLANFYAWSNRGLWRVPDRSEPGPMDIGSNRDDMQRALELDVAAYVRLHARRDAIGGIGEPDWSLAITPATHALLLTAGMDPSSQFDAMDDHGIGPSGLRVDSVRHRRGCILAHVHLGSTSHGPVEYDSYEDRSEIRITDLPLPETVLAGIVGEPLSLVMPHPVLDTLDLRISGTQIVTD